MPVKYTNAQIIEGLESVNGMVYLAARKIGCSAQTIYNRMKSNATIRAACDNARGELIDISEQKLRLAVMNGEPWAVAMVLKTIGKSRGYVERQEVASTNGNAMDGKAEPVIARLDASQIGRSFIDMYRDILAHGHTEYVLADGRGSGKSSFAGLVDVVLLVNNPTWHVLCIREHANTLRNSVFSQIQWAVDQLGLSEKFKFTTSPLEVTYLPTGQKIFFRGANDPMSIKSIKPPFGAIAVLHFEEYDQLPGPEAVRSIMQSAIRGTDIAYIFKVFNTPRSMNHWANKEIATPKENRYLHRSSYLEMPPEWLGRVFLDEAEYLKQVNPDAYDNEYMGIANGTGGMVFPNVELRAITDAEIKLYDNIYEGLDFGYAVDPLHWGRMSYHAGRRELYIYDEFRAVKMGNKELAETLIAQKGCGYSRLIIADSAEPKSIADLNTYGLTVKGAEKPPESVRYSMKWLQNLAKIVIDPERCPYTAQEFTSYEYPRTKDGLVMSIYPDENDHSIASTRYALNLQWRKAGN